MEYEGGGHREEAQFEYDLGRYARLRDAGWTVVQVSKDQLTGPKAGALIRRVRSLLA